MCVYIYIYIYTHTRPVWRCHIGRMLVSLFRDPCEIAARGQSTSWSAGTWVQKGANTRADGVHRCMGYVVAPRVHLGARMGLVVRGPRRFMFYQLTHIFNIYICTTKIIFSMFT